jgi:hypothetical protein
MFRGLLLRLITLNDTRYDYPGRVISSSQRPLPAQHTTYTTDINAPTAAIRTPQSLKESGRKLTPQ